MAIFIFIITQPFSLHPKLVFRSGLVHGGGAMSEATDRTEAAAWAEIIILAGGLSSRMGRDKARIQLGNRSMVGHVRHAAKRTGLAVKVLRRDCIPRCGPMGGIYSGLIKAQSPWVMFLACDMPWVTPEFLVKILKHARNSPRGVFTSLRGRPGFPLVLPKTILPILERQIKHGRLALSTLARTIRARRVPATRREAALLVNLNAPDDLPRTKAVP